MMISNILLSFFVNLTNIGKFVKAVIENVVDTNDYQNIFRRPPSIYTFSFNKELLRPVKTESQKALDQLIIKNTEKCEETLNDLILLLTTCVVETSKEFRTCMKNQLYLLRAGRNYNVGKLTMYQKQAVKLKVELDKFENMIENIEQMAQEQSYALALSEKPKPKCMIICTIYSEFQEKMELQYQMNRNWESDVAYKTIRMGVKDRSNEKDDYGYSPVWRS